MIELAVPLEDYLFDAVAEGLNIRTMEGRATFSKRAAPLLDRLPKGVFRELMFESLATRTGLNRRVLDELVLEQKERVDNYIVTTANEANYIKEKNHEPEAVPKGSLPRQQLPIPDSWSDPKHFPTDEPPADYTHHYQDDYPSSTNQRTSNKRGITEVAGKYLMPPARKAIALLLSNPQLACHETDDSLWMANEDQDIQLLGRLLKVLHERPHYNLSHLVGYWRGTYGAENTERLASIAGHDLLQAANALTLARENKPAKADYDTLAAFKSAMDKLRLQQNRKKSSQSLEKLKTSDFTQLSKEERDRLVREALANKLEP
jgi:DNA primase